MKTIIHNPNYQKMILIKQFTLNPVLTKLTQKLNLGTFKKPNFRKPSLRKLMYKLPSIPTLEGLEEIIEDLEAGM